jgi:hypothetical protein
VALGAAAPSARRGVAARRRHFSNILLRKRFLTRYSANSKFVSLIIFLFPFLSLICDALFLLPSASVSG